ncbi:hypothetical protein HOD20_06250 [archaeon]|jgi:predicted DsbA family dithiol-disulfide isomerase|nr:hypothetical protein [archaeon]MBT4352104.1 hypothetical protein [archaeon]MBT4648298.1 hypothetical protein [archaeon]MBT6822288.1 hypothetical protein [archaeon]MBT7393061.1 hypothetical protein [archaeon]
MEKAHVEVFTSPTCPHCPSAKKIAKEVCDKREDVKFLETSTMTSKGSKRAQKFDVRGVPTLIITGPGTNERIGYVGTPSKDSLNNMINIALGKEKWKEKKSILDKISKKLKINFKI